MSEFFVGNRVRIIDSHTGGEPTRVVIDGAPDLGSGSMADRRIRFRDSFDSFRSAVVNEPRGSDVIVGALVCEPVDPSAVAGVLFFNNVGPLWMCGHGAIGLGVTLGHLGRIGKGNHRFDTAVGPVTIEYDGANRVSFENVHCYRFAKNVSADVEGIGSVTGDIAWGGNWFFLVDTESLSTNLLRGCASKKTNHFGPGEIETLTDIAWRIRQGLKQSGITGADGGEIDHIELFGPPGDSKNHSRNFVLCPGRAYDRSPCGTGTSAKLACLYEDGKWTPGDVWRQESMIGSVFEGSIRIDGDEMIPRITGTAYITAEATLIFDPSDPFRLGIRSQHSH